MGRKPHADSKRDEIFRVAARLFAERGVDGTSMKQIAAAAGVTDAAIYKHFATKDELAKRIYSHYARVFTAVGYAAAGVDGSFGAKLDAMVADIVHLQEEDSSGLQLLGDWVRLPEPPPEALAPARTLAAFITVGIEAGELPQQDPFITGGMFLGAMIRLTVDCRRGPVERSLSDMVPEVQARVRGLFGLR